LEFQNKTLLQYLVIDLKKEAITHLWFEGVELVVSEVDMVVSEVFVVVGQESG